MSDNVCVQICSRKGEHQKESVSVYSYIPFHVGGCVYVCVSIYVCVAWTPLPPEILQTGAGLTGSQICVYSRLKICLYCFFVFHTLLKQHHCSWQGNTFSPFFPPAHILFQILYTQYLIAVNSNLAVFCVYLRGGKASSSIRVALTPAPQDLAPCCFHHLIKH